MKPLVYLVFIMFLSCQNSEQTPSPKEKSTTETTESQTKNLPNEVKTVLGIDVSHYQGNVDWNSIKKDGVLFGYAKATEGTSYIDPEFNMNWNTMTKNDIYKGAYHFYRYEDNALIQAKHFISTVKNLKGDLPPVVDLEGSGIESKMSIQSFQKSVSVWLQAVEKSLGVKPIIYTNTSFGNKYLNNPLFANYDLWLAEYVKENPTIPEVWKTKGWLIWQRSQEGAINGINGNVDHDIFNGDLNTFQSVFFNK